MKYTCKNGMIFINGVKKKTYWTRVVKPDVEAVLKQMDAPKQWKKGMLKLEKGLNTARNVLCNSGNWQSAIESMDGYHDLAEWLGGHNWNLYETNPRTKYWEEYSDIRGLSYNWNFGDALC